jgi:hypothetical protein
MKVFRWIPVLALMGLLLPMACDDTLGPEAGPAQIRILLTDAPADYLESADVCISRVYLVPGEDREDNEGNGEGNGPNWVDLFNDPGNPLCYNLLELRDGITADLTDAEEVEPGEYGQLRLVVSSAEVTLADPYEFNNGGVTRPLFIPSGMQTGIKVLLNESIEAEDGTLTTLIVDFDVNENFVIQGNPDTPAGIHGILFTPVLKEKGRSQGAAEN